MEEAPHEQFGDAGWGRLAALHRPQWAELGEDLAHCWHSAGR